MIPFLFNVFFSFFTRSMCTEKKILTETPFVSAIRSLTRRFDGCLSEIHKIGYENANLIPKAVMDEIASIYKLFQELELQGLDMKKEVHDKCQDEEPDTQFSGQWNRVIRYVNLYESMFGKDSEVVAEYEEWKKAQTNY